MSEKKVVFKKSCTYSQTPGLVSVKQLMIVDEGGKNYLAMRLVNERDEAVSAVTVKITEYDEGGKVICVTPIDFEVRGGANAVFVPDQKIELEDDTRDCDVVVLSAVYGAYVYKAVRNKVVVDYNAEGPAPTVAPQKRKYSGKAGDAGIEVKPRRLKAPFLVIFAIIASIVAAVLAVYVHMSVFVATEKTFLYNGVEYAFENDDTSDGTDIYVVGFNGFRSRIVIPKEIEGHTVKGIRDGAFKNNRSISSIEFESELPVGDHAFQGCTALRTVEFEKISSFGKGAFKDCVALDNVVIRAEMSEVPDEAFFGCTALATVLFEETGDKIRLGSRVFENCVGLRSMEFKRRIDYGKSGNCDFLRGAKVDDLRLLNFELPAGISGGISRLFGADGKDVTLGKLYIDYLAAIPDGFARGIATLTSFDTAYVESADIGNDAFNGCIRMSAFSIPKPVTAVGTRAFSGTAIKEFDFTAVTAIGDNAFNNTKLENVSFKGNTAIQTIGASAFAGCSALTRVTLPIGMTNINSSLFSGCTSLTDVQTLGECVISSIGTEAFAGCSALSAIPTLGGNIKQIGVRAFKGCTGLVDIVVPDTVTLIGSGAFADCNGVRKYTAPFIGLSVGSGAGYLASVFGGSSMTSSSAVPQSLVSVTVTKSTELYTGAFYKLKNLKSVTLPDGLVAIGDSAFFGCTGLTAIELPLSVVTISDSAFCGCSGLHGIELPDGLIGIGNQAFFGCAGFKTFTAPKSVQYIGVNAFGDCPELGEITMPYAIGGSFGLLFGGKPPESLEKVTIVGSSTLPASAFYACENIREIVLPNSLTYIGVNAFYGCTSITKLVIPSGVTYIGMGAIAKMISLEELSTPFVGMSQHSGMNGAEWRFAYMISVDSYYSYVPLRSLKKITLTNSTVIGPLAFIGGEYIQSITLDCKVDKIYDAAFDGCYALYEVFNGSGLNIVKGSAANGGIARDVLAVHDGVDAQPLPRIEYDGYTFVRNTDGKNYMVDYPYESYEQINPDVVPGIVIRTELPAAVVADGQSFGEYYIWQYLFRNAPFRSVYIPASVVGIGCNAFAYSDNLLGVEFAIDSKLATIEAETFRYCSRLYDVQLPNTVSRIGEFAFGGCARLKKFVVGKNVTSIDDYAFDDCLRLFEVYNYSDLDIAVGGFDHGGVARDAKVVYSRQQLLADPDIALPQTIIDGVQYMAFQTNGKSEWWVVDYYGNDGALELNPFVYIGASGAEIIDKLKIYPGAFDFEGDSVTKLVIGNVLSDITVENFGGLYSLTEIIISANGGGYDEMSIGNYAFGSAAQVKTISSDVKIAKIGEYAFPANAMEKIKFGDVGTVEQFAFFGDNSGSITAEFGHVGEFKENAFIGLGSLKRLTADKVDVIGEKAFSNCGLTDVSLGSVQEIGDGAFSWCYNLRNVDLGSYAGIKIGSLAFAGTALPRFAYAARIDSIGNNAFEGCGSLQSFIVSEVGSIGEYAFNGCGSLATVRFNGKVNSIDYCAFASGGVETVEFGGDVGTIGTRAFSGNAFLKSVSFGGELTSLGSRAFGDAYSLEKIVLPDTLTAIPDYAFESCSGLREITLPSNLDQIGTAAFSSCYGVIMVYNRSNVNVTDYFYYPIAIVNNAADAAVEYYTNGGMQFVKVVNKWYLINGCEYRRGVAFVPAEFKLANGDVVKNFGVAKNALSGYSYIFIGKNVTEIVGPALPFYSSYIYYEGNAAQWSAVYKSDISVSVLYYSDCIHDDNYGVWRYTNDGIPTTTVTEFTDTDWVVTVEPTCLAQGKSVAVCPHCDREFEVVLSKLSHEVEGDTCRLCGSAATVVSSANIDKLDGVVIANDKDNPFTIGADGVMTVKAMYSTLKITATHAVDVIITCSTLTGDSSVMIYVNGEQYGYIPGYSGTRGVYISLNAGDVITISYSRSGGGYDTVGAQISNMTVIYTEEQHDNA